MLKCRGCGKSNKNHICRFCGCHCEQVEKVVKTFTCSNEKIIALEKAGKVKGKM
jgi:hypothetical protein